jgi:hypothetical protein
MYSLPKTVNEVIDHLDIIVKNAIKERNRIGYFASLYLLVTIEVRNKIEQSFFENNELIEKLDVVFANRFLDAYYKHKEKEEITSSWQLAFKASSSWHPLVIQHLFLGMNAHIGLDLGIAAAAVCPGESISTINGDFIKVNDILGSLGNKVQDNLSSIWPLLKYIDWLAGKLDEGLTNFSIEIARDAAWKVALDIATLETKEEQTGYIHNRDKKVADFSRKLYQPGLVLSILCIIIRITEIGTVKSKIRKLNEQ